MKPLRIAVTGAAGRIGSVLVRRLGVMPDFELVAIVRNALAARLLAGAGAEVRIGSLADPASGAALLADCDAVVNCALGKGWPAVARAQNEAIIRAIADAPRVRTVVHFSSVAVYGPCVDPRRNSFDRPRPDSSYGLDKLALERFAARLLAGRGKRYYLVRLGHVYGPSQWVSRDIEQRSTDESFALPFGGEIASNAVSIEAVIAAVAAMLRLEPPAGVRNLVDFPQATWRELFDRHTDLMGRPPVASLSADASWRMREAYYAAARQPMLDLARSGFAALGATNLVALAKLETFRRLARGPLLSIPGGIAAWASRRYLRRKVRAALRDTSSGPSATDVLCAPPVPGPGFATIDPAAAFDTMRDELRAWLQGFVDYRWDHSDLDASSPRPDLERAA